MKFLGFNRDDATSRFRKDSSKSLSVEKIDDGGGKREATEEMNRSFVGTEVRGWSVRQRRLDRVIGARARKVLMELGKMN